ncbi:MAG: BCCT family transporter [Opitutales bacterium]
MSRIVRKQLFGVEIEAHPIVFPISACLIIVFVVLAAAAPKHTYMVFEWLQHGIATNFGWLYILAMTGFLVYAVYLVFSRFGHIRLGTDDERPQFSRLTWFAMLFSAGMGIGMLFWGVAEPMFHYLNPPLGEARTPEAARQAMGLTLFHWCLHPWSLYALVALSLAFFGFRRGVPMSFRSVFYPFLGKRIHGRLGDVIDVMAVLATLFGLATSLGLGAKQVNAGLAYVFGLPQGIEVQILIIALITCAAVASLISGLEVGIRRLSEINMGLAGSLLVFLFVGGPTVYLISALVENVGVYLSQLPERSFLTATYGVGEGQKGWLSGWTVFYWGWWIAWSPFVGMFIARISKGRTIREFILGTLIVPSTVAIIWMTGFGNSALHQELAAESEKYGYEPQTRAVQVQDEQTGLPLAAEGDNLVAADVKGVASPTHVLLEPEPVDSQAEESRYRTADGAVVAYNEFNVLVDAESRAPYNPTEAAIYHGAFESESADIRLGDYLSQPVLTKDRSQTVDATATAMFFMLEGYPLSKVTALIGTICVILFFITSSDSASLVADIIASGGSENPTTGTRIFWGALEGTLAAVLLLAGGLTALQTGSITIGLPFCIIVILMVVCLHIGMRRELRGEIPLAQRAHAAGDIDSSGA